MSQISLSHREDYERLFRAGVACATVYNLGMWPRELYQLSPHPSEVSKSNTSFNWLGKMKWPTKKQTVTGAFVPLPYNTHTIHNTQPFYGSVDFVRDNPGEPVPEETFTHSHPSWSSIIPICFLHLLQSMASSVFNPHALQSFSTISLQVLLGLPLGLAPSIAIQKIIQNRYM